MFRRLLQSAGLRRRPPQQTEDTMDTLVRVYQRALAMTGQAGPSELPDESNQEPKSPSPCREDAAAESERLASSASHRVSAGAALHPLPRKS